MRVKDTKETSGKEETTESKRDRQIKRTNNTTMHTPYSSYKINGAKIWYNLLDARSLSFIHLVTCLVCVLHRCNNTFVVALSHTHKRNILVGQTESMCVCLNTRERDRAPAPHLLNARYLCILSVVFALLCVFV